MDKGTLLIKTDGGARGNPGPAAVGIFIQDTQSEKCIKAWGRTIGKSTNNVAEYQAIIDALTWVKANINVLTSQYTQIQLRSDSALVINQINGNYKIKNIKLQQLAWQVKKIERDLILSISYQHVPRELNKEPDSLLNNILDKNNTG